MQQQSELWLYLDILPYPSKVSSLSSLPEMLCSLHSHTKGIRLEDSETIMVFLKHFDTIKQSLFGVGGIHIPRVSKVSDLIRKNLCD